MASSVFPDTRRHLLVAMETTHQRLFRAFKVVSHSRARPETVSVRFRSFFFVNFAISKIRNATSDANKEGEKERKNERKEDGAADRVMQMT